MKLCHFTHSNRWNIWYKILIERLIALRRICYYMTCLIIRSSFFQFLWILHWFFFFFWLDTVIAACLSQLHCFRDAKFWEVFRWIIIKTKYYHATCWITLSKAELRCPLSTLLRTILKQNFIWRFKLAESLNILFRCEIYHTRTRIVSFFLLEKIIFDISF